MAKNRNRRLRKKLRVDEFKEFMGTQNIPEGTNLKEK